MYFYHAGSHYARLWEQAGTASASSPGLNGAIGAGWKGIPEIRAFDRLLRSKPSCKQIGLKFEISERDVAPVLEQDLVACAKCFGYK